MPGAVTPVTFDCLTKLQSIPYPADIGFLAEVPHALKRCCEVNLLKDFLASGARPLFEVSIKFAGRGLAAVSFVAPFLDPV
jgi:hypothetical protein